jgi:DNA modification methylase
MQKPYYEDESIILYNADNKDVLPHIKKESVGLLLTDAPYGINLARKGGQSRNKNKTIVNDEKPFDPTHLLGYDKIILWGGNNFIKYLEPHGWLVWDKRIKNEFCNRGNMSDGEIAWTNLTYRVLIFRHLWVGAIRATENGDPVYHPTQKPIALMEWCIRLWGYEGLVLDPYCGSGSIMIAAKRLGRKAIGIEIEEKYCEITAKRLMQVEAVF